MSEEYEIEVIPVVVSAEPIELYKILKIENLVTSGSEAKSLIADGYVYVNGEVETRKRKKIMFGDIIGFDGEAYQVLSEADMLEYGAMEDDSVVSSVTVENEPELAAPVTVTVTPVIDLWEQPVKAAAITKKPVVEQKKAKPKKVNKQSSAPQPKNKKGRAAPFNF